MGMGLLQSRTGGWLQHPRHDTVNALVAGFDGFGAQAAVPCRGFLCCAFIGCFALFQIEVNLSSGFLLSNC